MKLRTKINIQGKFSPINHSQSILMLGSCFSVNIGNNLLRYKFSISLNPCGITYNPISIAKTLWRLRTHRPYSEADLTIIEGVPIPFSHHGSFRRETVAETLQAMNESWNVACQSLVKTKHLFLTFGTAYVWQRDEEIVNNCHKRPRSEFVHRLLTVEEIVSELVPVFQQLTDMQIILNVSPIRHLHSGLSGNCLSKSTLRLACHHLSCQFQNVSYFPSFEAVIDDLRDYRFYGEDLLHPSSLAVQYIWKLFEETFFSSETITRTNTIDHLYKRLNHRPLYPESNSSIQFVQATEAQLCKLMRMYPNASWREEQLLLERQKIQR